MRIAGAAVLALLVLTGCGRGGKQDADKAGGEGGAKAGADPQTVPAGGAALEPGLVGEYFTFSPQETPALLAATDPRKPALRRADPLVCCYQDQRDFGRTGLKERVYVRWTGQIYYSGAPACVFYLAASGAARLFVDGKELAAVEGRQETAEKSAAANLASGYHDVRVEFAQLNRQPAIVLGWRPAGQAKTVVPESALYHRPAEGLSGRWARTYRERNRVWGDLTLKRFRLEEIRKTVEESAEMAAARKKVAEAQAGVTKAERSYQDIADFAVRAQPEFAAISAVRAEAEAKLKEINAELEKARKKKLKPDPNLLQERDKWLAAQSSVEQKVAPLRKRVETRKAVTDAAQAVAEARGAVEKAERERADLLRTSPAGTEVQAIQTELGYYDLQMKELEARLRREESIR